MTALGPIIGIDISKWDGNWDANKAKAQGATFVFIKASQATYTDPQFLLNWQKAKDAGLLRGAYHYLDYTKPGKDQANAFADLIKSDPGELPPAIDYELRRSDNNPAAALVILRDCLDQLMSRTELFADSVAKKPMLYASPGFWAEYGDMTKRDYWLQFPLWLAHYTTSMTPLLPSPWPLWKFWQFTAKGPGEVFGSECLTIDMNRFNGTLSELMEFAGVQIPVINLNELYNSLASRTKAVEDAVASLSPSGLQSTNGLMDRVTNLEQQLASLSLSNSPAMVNFEQRLAALEKVIAGIGTLGSQTNPIAASPADPAATSSPDPSPVASSDAVTTPPIPAVLDSNQPSEINPPPASDPSLQSAGKDVFAVCNTSALNVRSGPAATYPMVAGIYMGQQVKVLKRQNGWSQIENPAGWCNETYLTFDKEEPIPTIDLPQVSPSDIFGICNTSGLNVRGGPGVAFPIVGGLTYGQRTKILTRKSGWAQIERPSGWCNESYLSFA
jgi:lysozyme